MDFYQFINSRDIEEYLRDKKYALSSVQCAYLVWASRRAHLETKRDAWREIISSMPDSLVEHRPNCAGWPSLHGMLRDYMAVQDKYLALFHQNGGKAVYTYAIEYGSDLKEGGPVFTRESECRKAAMLDLALNPSAARITKHYLDPGGNEPKPVQISVRYTADEHICGIDLSGFSPYAYERGESLFTLPKEWLMTEEEENVWDFSFAGMWFDFPTPFQKGDVLCDRFTWEKPFVLMGIAPRCKMKNERRPSGDPSGMFAWGSCYDKDDDFLFDDYMVNYLDCEYFSGKHYHGEITGEQRLVSIYAMHLRGEIDTWTLLKSYRSILAEAQADSAGWADFIPCPAL